MFAKLTCLLLLSSLGYSGWSAGAQAPDRPATSQAERVERESRAFPVGGAPRISVATFDGNVTVRSWDRAEVMFTAIKRAQDDHEMRGVSLRAEQHGAEITIRADFDRAFRREVVMANGQRFMSDSASVELVVYVPRSNVTLRVSSGDNGLRVEDVAGDLELHTDDGPVLVSNGRGRLRASTADGEIRITNFDGEASAQTGDGPITLSGRFTRLAARTDDGEISLLLAADTNATIVTNAERVSNVDGLAVAEAVSGDTRRERRWRVGSGGNLFTLHAEQGAIYLRRAGSGHAATQ